MPLNTNQPANNSQGNALKSKIETIINGLETVESLSGQYSRSQKALSARSEYAFLDGDLVIIVRFSPELNYYNLEINGKLCERVNINIHEELNFVDILKKHLVFVTE